MTLIPFIHSTHSNTPAPHPHIRAPHEAEFSKPISPTAIGLMCGLGSCGMLGLIIWAVIYFRSKPTTLARIIHKGQRTDEENNNTDGENRGRAITVRGMLLQDRSGVTTARHSADGDGDGYPSVGIAVNAGLEREILEILDAEAEADSARAMARMGVSA